MKRRNFGFLLSLCCLLPSGFAFEFECPAFASKVSNLEISSAKTQRYLDEVWTRLTRGCEKSQLRFPDFTPILITIEIQKNGEVSNLEIAPNQAGLFVNNQLRRTIQACEPFPALKMKGKPSIKVDFSVQSKNSVVDFDVELAGDLPTISDQSAAKQDAISDLIADLHNPNKEIRLNALKTLKLIAPNSAACLHEILLATKDEDQTVALEAWSAIETIGPQAKALIPELAESLSRGNDERRKRACSALAAIGIDAEEVAPMLLELVDPSRDYWVRKFALEAISKMSQATKQRAARILLREFNNESHTNNNLITKLGSGAVPILVEGIEEGEGFVPLKCLDNLHLMGETAAPAVPALIGVVEQGKGDEKELAIRTLGEIGAPAKAAVPALMKAVAQGSNEAVEALGKIGADAHAAIPLLQKRLSSSDSKISYAAKEALRMIQAHD